MNSKAQPTDAATDSPPLVPGSRRGKPGRPPKPLPGPDPGLTTGIARVQTVGKQWDNGEALVVLTVSPRLLDLRNAARYLAISEWTVRDLEHAGVLPRIHIPMPRSHDGRMRKLLFDINDLDRLVAGWKDGDGL